MKRLNLAKARKDADYTQQEIADVIGITKQQYQRLEAGTSNGNTKRWEQLSRLLGVAVDDLLQQTSTPSATG